MDTSYVILISGSVGALVATFIVGLIAILRLNILRERAIRAEAALEAERNGHAARIEAIHNAEQQLRESFARLSSEALSASTNRFLTLAQERLERQQQTVRGDLNALFGPLRQSLDQQREQVSALEQQRANAYGGLSAIVAELKEGQQLLNRETNNLVKALSKPQVRGRWGEMQLRRVIEMAGMLEYCDFDVQVTVPGDKGAQRPDLIVRLPNQRQIVVDSKTPLEAFLQALNADDSQRTELFCQHARQLRTHVDDIYKRNYPVHIDGAHEFTVIFIPGETFYQTALEYDSGLLDYAFTKGVILASPNTLIAILKAAGLGWRETRLAAEAKTIRDEGEKIYKALRSVAEHLSKLGDSLGKATAAYNDVIGSVEARLLPPARKMNELGIRDAKEAPDLSRIETSLRPIVRPELFEGMPAPEVAVA